MQQDLFMLPKNTALPGYRTSELYTAGLQQRWQHTTVLRLQVQRVQLHMQPMQPSPICSGVTVLATHWRAAADPLVVCHRVQRRCPWYTIAVADDTLLVQVFAEHSDALHHL